jgi:ketosteroid isomerase-like protein
MSKQQNFLMARCFAACLVAILMFAGSAAANDKQKNKKNNDASTSDQAAPVPAPPDTEQIDHDIGEMLGAFQIGDVETMHKHYADNVTFVSGHYAPPIVGWQNYAAMYERQKTAFQGMQLIRRNTLIITHTDFAWATYQWEFDSSVNGRPYSLRGQTTLIFSKVNGNWLIVHNHTSAVYPESAPSTAQQATPSAAVTRP